MDHIDVEVVLGGTFFKECESKIRKGFCTRRRAQFTVKIRYVEQIPSAKSGKFHYVISEIATKKVDALANASVESSNSVNDKCAE